MMELFAKIVNPFHVISIPPKKIRKLEVSWCFQGLWKEASGMKWVKSLFDGILNTPLFNEHAIACKYIIVNKVC